MDFPSLYALDADFSVYSHEAILKACYWLSRDFYFHLVPLPNGIQIRFRPKDTAVPAEKAYETVCCSLVDFSLRQVIAHETASVREAIVSCALAEARSGASLAD